MYDTYFPMHEGARKRMIDMNPVMLKSAELFATEFLKRRRDLEDEIDNAAEILFPDDDQARLDFVLDVVELAQDEVDEGAYSAEEAVTIAIEKLS